MRVALQWVFGAAASGCAERLCYKKLYCLLQAPASGSVQSLVQQQARIRRVQVSTSTDMMSWRLCIVVLASRRQHEGL
jgi:hypothetical protein